MTLPAVHKTVTIDLPPEAAFRRFTEEIAAWWPMHTHSVGQAECETVVLEAKKGGRFYERLTDGTECEWGIVLEYDPPHRLAFTWYPGREADTAQEVELQFRASESGTEVQLHHRNWEVFGDDAGVQRKGYDGGWERVLGQYLARRP